MRSRVREDQERLEPDAKWRVGYLIRPTMEVTYWEGEAPSRLAAQLFASKAIVTELGLHHVQVTHIKTERIG